MPGPRPPIGTFGDIEVTNLTVSLVRARVRFRDLDGQLRRIEATGVTRKLAEHRLTEKFTRRVDCSPGSGDFTADSPFAQLISVWLNDLDLTGAIVMPAFENLTLWEILVRQAESSGTSGPCC